MDLPLVGDRAVLDPARDNEQLTRSEHDVAVAELDRQPPRQNEEQLVAVLMAMPDKFATNLDDLDLVIIQLRERLPHILYTIVLQSNSRHVDLVILGMILE